MGFPVGYTDLFLPKLLVHILTLLGFLRRFITAIFGFLGLGEFLEPEMSFPAREESAASELHSVSAALIRELLPVVKFSELVEAPESCAVCLYEFDGEDEIRRLTNCRHIFHRNCLDRWMDHDQKTCPLCRTPFIPEDMQESFNERLWLASGISDFYGDYPTVAAGVNESLLAGIPISTWKMIILFCK
nr:E3 ubiquitin-protein ligase RHA1B-like [Ipomoea batatas]